MGTGNIEYKKSTSTSSRQLKEGFMKRILVIVTGLVIISMRLFAIPGLPEEPTQLSA